MQSTEELIKIIDNLESGDPVLVINKEKNGLCQVNFGLFLAYLEKNLHSGAAIKITNAMSVDNIRGQMHMHQFSNIPISRISILERLTFPGTSLFADIPLSENRPFRCPDEDFVEATPATGGDK